MILDVTVAFSPQRSSLREQRDTHIAGRFREGLRGRQNATQPKSVQTLEAGVVHSWAL